MKKEIIKISGMTCNHCVKSVAKAIKSLPVEAFKVEINMLEVEYNDSKVTKQQIADAVEEEGYIIIN